MPRNKMNPREYTKDPQKRNSEKMARLLEWLIQFHHSTRTILLERLGLNVNSHHRYFMKLIDKGIIQKTRVYSIKEQFVYMLTNLGKELAAEQFNNAIQYNTDKTKINHVELRHSLAIQNAVLTFWNEPMEFFSEKFLDRNVFNQKIPDAILIKDNKLTMLEVELSPKKEDRIFRAFTAHANLLISNKCQKVLYVFPSKTLQEYYLARFNLDKWPKFVKDNKTGWIKEGNFFPDEYKSLREKFEFIEDKMVIRYL